MPLPDLFWLAYSERRSTKALHRGVPVGLAIMSGPDTPESFPESLRSREVRVTEVGVKTTGVLPRAHTLNTSTTVSTVALVLGALGIVLAPVLGIGVVPAVLGAITGHIAKWREPLGRTRSMVALAVSYVALIVGTAILVLVTLPVVLAFLVSAGYILAD